MTNLTTPYGPLPLWLSPSGSSGLAQIDSANPSFQAMMNEVWAFLPSLLWAIVLLIIGWLVATVAAAATKKLLSLTHVDDRIANWLLGQTPEQEVPVEQWAATAVYWIVFTFAIVAFLNALNLEVVSQPLNNFLEQIFAYLPRIGGAALLLGVAWVIATLIKALVSRGLAWFNLDDRLSQQAGIERGSSPFVLNETIANILYWFVFLLFIPLVLSTLNISGLIAPLESLINTFFQAIPRIITAGLILVFGWLVARVVRGIVTNLMVSIGSDQFGTRLGLKANTQEGVSLSSLTGTIVYVLILIPAVVAALNELSIEAISEPAVLMLERILEAVPAVLMAAVVLVGFYFVGKFVADLVTSVLTNVGFDNILSMLGLPELSVPAAAEAQPTLDAEGRPTTTVRSPSRTPSEVVGLLALVGIVLFGAITATEILGFDQLTDIVRAILRVSAQVLSGLVVFAVGLYLANLAYRLVSAMGGGQAKILAQTARISVIALVGAMALQQMGVATNIVNLAFGLLLGAVAVAVAIAFGLGGRDVANELLRDWLNAFRQSR
jgi:hypothetical protein